MSTKYIGRLPRIPRIPQHAAMLPCIETSRARSVSLTSIFTFREANSHAKYLKGAIFFWSRKNDTTTGIKISQIYSGKIQKKRKINRVNVVLIQKHPSSVESDSIGLLSYWKWVAGCFHCSWVVEWTKKIMMRHHLDLRKHQGTEIPKGQPLTHISQSLVSGISCIVFFVTHLVLICTDKHLLLMLLTSKEVQLGCAKKEKRAFQKTHWILSTIQVCSPHQLQISVNWTGQPWGIFRGTHHNSNFDCSIITQYVLYENNQTQLQGYIFHNQHVDMARQRSEGNIGPQPKNEFESLNSTVSYSDRDNVGWPVQIILWSW